MEENDVVIEGEILRKLKATDSESMPVLKPYKYRLIGKELCVFKTQDSDSHKGMQILVGAFL